MAVRAILSEREKSQAAAGFLSAFHAERREDTVRAIRNCANIQTLNASAQVVSSLISTGNPVPIILLIAPGGSEQEMSNVHLPGIAHLEYAATEALQGSYVLVSTRAVAHPLITTNVPLRASYDAFDWCAVDKFLSAAPFLEDLLLEARPIIKKIFGEATRISLEIVDEPDAPGQVELFGFIHTAVAPREGSRRLDAFDREWWLAAVQRSQGKLNFSLRYE